MLVLAAGGDDSGGSPTTTSAAGGSDEESSGGGTSGEVPAGVPAASMTDYGSDAALDTLADECESGELSAGDSLYEDSPEFSPYEDHGITCGGRYDPSEEDLGDAHGQLAVRRSGGSECEALFADAG